MTTITFWPDADSARTPGIALRVHEALVGLEMLKSATLPWPARQWPRGDGHPVMVLPGFLAGKASTRVLRRTLRHQGYWVCDWGLGRNLGMRDDVHGRLIHRMENLSERHGRRTVSLIGWSAGGSYARELARERPDLVRNVITLGSPMRGNLEASPAVPLFRRLSDDGTLSGVFTPEAKAARAEPLTVPTTCIYSKVDGIVPWQCATSLPAPLTENVEVHCTHLGYGVDRETLAVIADRLARREGQWVPYAGVRR